MRYISLGPNELTKFIDQEVHVPLYRHYLGYDIWMLSRCHAMLLCPGWKNSKGCKIEVLFAIQNNIPIYDYNTLELFDFSILKSLINKLKLIIRYFYKINTICVK